MVASAINEDKHPQTQAQAQARAQNPSLRHQDGIPQAPRYSEETRWALHMDQLPHYDSSWETPVPHDMSLGILYAYHKKHDKLWEESKASRQTHELTKEIFQTQARCHFPIKISSCICLGLGSFFGLANIGHTFDEDRIAPSVITDCVNNRNMSQLVAFEKWVSILRGYFDIPHIYFQDPAFNSLDRAFLASLGVGFQVIDSPTSSNVLSEESFLFAPNLNTDALYASLKFCFPALYIGNRLYNQRIDVPESAKEFLKDHPWIRNLEGAFSRSKENKPFFRLSAWEEDYDHYVWGSIYWPRTENNLAKELRKGPPRMDRRDIRSILGTYIHRPS